MTTDFSDPEFAPKTLLEFDEAGSRAGTTCALLTPAIKAKLGELDSGDVLEVRVSDPTARDDILSWSRLSGHAVLGIYADGPERLRFYLRKK